MLLAIRLLLLRISFLTLVNEMIPFISLWVGGVVRSDHLQFVVTIIGTKALNWDFYDRSIFVIFTI